MVGGEDLSLDHGFPARTMIPAAPGVHATKWVGRLTVVTP
ncbi:molybdopterin-dependent oxidoreductase [Pseudonocardia oceani]|nr:molybdopterin-dependent oxidoreductase [Pseudonocardia oceani]